MKIMVVGRKFHQVAGGVERMAILLMNEMAARGHEVHLLTWDLANPTAHYAMDERINWHALDLGDALVAATWGLRLKRQLRMRNILKSERPDVVVAFQEGAYMAIRLSAVGLGIPVIASERNAPQRFTYLRMGKYKDWIYQTFRFASRVTVQFDSYRDLYPSYLRGRIVAISNPVDASAGKAEPDTADEGVFNLLCVGRLSYQKNQQVLLEAFAKVADRFKDWQLRLVGDGENEAKLKALANTLNLRNRVDFVGASKDVEAEYRQAHVFCMPSLWEGFPNAVAEAMAHGLPVIGFRICAGVNELIVPGENGILVEEGFSAERLAEAFETLMSNAALRREFGLNAQKISDRYHPSAVFDRWEALFVELAR